MTHTLAELAKDCKGHEKYRQQTPGHDYTNITFEFKHRKGARDFTRYVQQERLSKYAPFFCDEFKYAQVTVFESLETGKEQENEKATGPVS